MLNYQRVSQRNNFWEYIFLEPKNLGSSVCKNRSNEHLQKCELESTHAEDITSGATNCGALSEANRWSVPVMSHHGFLGEM